MNDVSRNSSIVTVVRGTIEWYLQQQRQRQRQDGQIVRSEYAYQDKLDEAEQMCIRALAGYEKALGPGHTSTLDIVNNIGIFYAVQGKLGEAEQMFARARNRGIGY